MNSATSVAGTTATFLRDILQELGGHHSLSVVESALALHPTDLDPAALADAATLLGARAQVVKRPPASWRDGRDGALIAWYGGRWIARVLRDGVIHDHPEAATGGGSAIDRADTLIHLEMLPDKDTVGLAYRDFAGRARRFVRHGIWQSLLINLAALSVPFFTMAVYDRVLGAGAASSLPALLSGGILVLAIMLLLRRLRSRMLAAEHARFGASVSRAVAQRVFRQPFLARDRLTADLAMGRIRQAERTADLFANSNTVAIFDAPFVLLTFVALMIVGGVLAVIPLIYVILFLGLGLLLGWTRKDNDPVEARLAARQRAMVSEMARAAEIRRTGVAQSWIARFDQLSRAAARATHRSQSRAGTMQGIGTALGSGTALVTLIVGLDLALQGELSPGTLIGTMLLTWRITGPVQGLFTSIPRLRTLHDAWQQLPQLLALPTISSAAPTQEPLPQEPLAIAGQGLFFRYLPGAEPALSGVSFDIPAGSTVVVMGPNGAGKSTLLRIIAGQIESQSGRLSYNERSASQFDPDSIAETIAWLPSDPLSALPASDRPAAVHGISEVEAEDLAWKAVTSREVPVYLLDDPLTVSGDEGRTRLLDFLSSKKGNATVILATHDTSLAAAADLALVLDEGKGAYFGPVTTPEAAPQVSPDDAPSEMQA